MPPLFRINPFIQSFFRRNVMANPIFALAKMKSFHDFDDFISAFIPLFPKDLISSNMISFVTFLNF